MKLYKLTNHNNRTRSGCKWAEDCEHHASGNGGLCGPGWLHAYTHPLLAVFLSPVHVDWWRTARLWEADGDVGKDDGTKVGCTRLHTIREIPLPVVTDEQRIRFGIGAAAVVWQKDGFLAWARGWLAGTDRTVKSAWAWEAAGQAAWAAWEAASAWAQEADTPLDLVRIAEWAMTDESLDVLLNDTN